jgi:CheY-like chemotaxis protein
MRILAVDDGPTMQWLREQLVPRGIEVAGASDADDAFRLWEKEGPWALVLTEHHIEPGTRIRDGRELVNAIRAADPSQRIAIHTDDEGLLAAPVVVLRKRYAIERLLRMLRQPVLPLK